MEQENQENQENQTKQRNQTVSAGSSSSVDKTMKITVPDKIGDTEGSASFGSGRKSGNTTILSAILNRTRFFTSRIGKGKQDAASIFETVHGENRTSVDISSTNTVFVRNKTRVNCPDHGENRENGIDPGLFEASFQVVREFASGGQGIISSAIDLALNRLVAVKALRPELVHEESIRSGFMQEAKITAQLDHPSIVPIYSLTENARECPCLIMKMINGQTFREYLDKIIMLYRRKGIAGYDEEKGLSHRLELFLNVCNAMEYAHSRNVMHCDLKPENVMIGEYHETYIMDWGIARLISRAGSQEAVKEINGTPRYMAPEVIRHEKADQRADVFALGQILFELVFLKYAYTGNDATTLMHKIKYGQCESYEHEFGIPVPADLSAIIARASATDPEQRYQSVAELAEDLRRYIAGNETTARPDTFLRALVRKITHHPRVLSSVIFTMFLIAAAGIIFSLYQKMNYAEEERLREAAVAEAYTCCIGAAVKAEQDLRAMHSSLAGFSDFCLFVLKNRNQFRNAKPEQPFFDYRLMNNPRTRPRNAFRNPAYADAYTDMTSCCYFAPGNLPKRKVDPLIQTMQHAREKFISVYTGTDLAEAYQMQKKTDPEKEDIRKSLFSASLPVRWLNLSFPNGLQISYPGSGDYGEDYNCTARQWYRKAAENPGTNVCSDPYYDASDMDMQKMILTFSRAVSDRQMQKILFVASMDVGMDSIQEALRTLGNTQRYTLNKVIFDESGRIICSLNRKYAPQPVPGNAHAIHFQRFPSPKLFKTIRKKKYGFLFHQKDGMEMLYVFASIPSMNWTYLEEIPFPAFYNKFIRHIKYSKAMHRIQVHSQ